MDRFLSGASEEDKADLVEMLNDMQVRDTQQMYNDLTSRCFRECVTDFRSTSLTAPEKKCITHCAKKFMAHMQRVGQRFAEQNYAAGQQ